MNTQGLAQYAGQVYKATAGLMKLVPDDRIDWKPADTNNWMTTGQLLEHLISATGVCINGFVTGEWPPMPEDGMMTSAEKTPTVTSVDDALERLETDRVLAMKLLDEMSEDDFSNKTVTAPWNSVPMPMWCQLLQMVEHQINHKAMLFAYLKLMGVEVNTAHLYGMV
jgi:uncharacterized damage-inducible protein DinB